jgi:uncharacterized protein YydD (DUF2326 family)
LIHRIFSSLTSFKTLEFGPGLNIILADKSPGATDTQTRNGAGKTSVVELIHFVLGGNLDQDSPFRHDALTRHRFGMDFDLSGARVRASRSPSESSRIYVSPINPDWRVRSMHDRTRDEQYVSVKTWKALLGRAMFDLPDPDEDTAAEKFAPTFRMLFPYFARRENAAGFAEPWTHHKQQQSGEAQVALMFLLGLDWTIAQELRALRKQEQDLETTRQFTQAEQIVVLPDVGELRTRLTVAEQQHAELVAQLTQFNVLPGYERMQAESDDVARQIRDLTNASTLDRRMISDIETSLISEHQPPIDELRKVYEEAGLLFPTRVVDQFDDVRKFRDSVVSNRRSYLTGQRDEAFARISGRELRVAKLDQRRQELFAILERGGALEQFSALQGEAGRQSGEVQALRQQFESATRFDQAKAELRVKRSQLALRLQRDFTEEGERLNRAIQVFQEVSRLISDNAGSLTIEATENGPKFDVRVHGATSRGISNVQIFCFDMTLARLAGERRFGPNFLVHDSHLFDPVDERQVGHALSVGSDWSRDHDFQYIVTLNSDKLPREGLGQLDLRSSIVPVRLTDATQDGGLFGIRFA